ncbi:hypothetical protein TUM17554_26100 [Klebsiella pneumoniae]|nr:hypothetical protein TUM17554_26100 [Klebsiella pneumoniae]
MVLSELVSYPTEYSIKKFIIKTIHEGITKKHPEEWLMDIYDKRLGVVEELLIIISKV